MDPEREPAIASARAALLSFYDAHRRAMPWRESQDPYAIWVSEVMLQQTRVETVIPFYERFLRRFATVTALAQADEADVLALWAGLGYYRRARLLHAGAKAVVARHEGKVPSDVTALKALPGVGAYTAGAIASIAFGLREPVLDGNVERVLSRWIALEGDPMAPAQRKVLWALAGRFADNPRPGDTNQALMELGATRCLPANPQCLLCPFAKSCAALALGTPERFPEKPKKAPPRTERWVAYVMCDPRGFWLGPAPSTLDRWTGMLLPPMVRLDADQAPEEIALAGMIRQEPLGTVTHILTHARMQITVFLATDLKESARPLVGEWVAPGELDARAIPKVTRVILAQAQEAMRKISSASARTKDSIRERKGRAIKGSSSASST
ncbi:MAG: A/G-specific adenine glycosylase [Deltaproteobacteria bacterium]|nr:A/G-specific adenine glycosylase [Deltaproteobacteria bacterium]